MRLRRDFWSKLQVLRLRRFAAPLRMATFMTENSYPTQAQQMGLNGAPEIAETADLSTPLRSGRDDNKESVVEVEPGL
jgi:hypothetical protein